MVSGQRSAVELAYREHGQALWRALFLYSGDREIASDAVAETFAQALGRGDELRSVERWIWRSAFLIARGMLKERGRPAAGIPQRPYQMPDSTIEMLETLQALSDKQRAAVILYYYADYPIREVAALLGSTASAVGVHLHRARRQLRHLLEATDA